MTCEQIREELELLVGQAELPQEVVQHLEDCADCRKYWDELTSVAHRLEDSSPFELTQSESAELFDRIERAIEPQEKTTITSLRWLRYAAAAAVVTLSVGIGYYEFRGGVTPDVTIPTDSTPDVSMALNPVLGDTLQLTRDEIEQVISEYSYNATVTSEEELLESLSEDDIKYLEENLDVGDLL